MSQNTSTAVMSRRVEPDDSLDFFPTPPWATRALCEYIGSHIHNLRESTCWEPACGTGDMARPLAEYFTWVHASDVAQLGFGEVDDFLFPGPSRVFHWIITNPPFRLAEQFVKRAIPQAQYGVAMFVRTVFLESVGRFDGLFSVHRPKVILQFAERVPIHKGKLTATGSTATSYCWVIWLAPYRYTQTEFDWIPPCRRKLERPGDYERN